MERAILTFLDHYNLAWHKVFISHKVFIKSYRKSQSPHKSVDLFFILVLAKDELTDLWGS